MDVIKEAFLRIKKDISLLFQEINLLKQELNLTKNQITSLNNQLYSKSNINTLPTYPQNNQTNLLNNPTNQQIFRPLNTQNLGISIGSEGVPTDRQTDRQTDNNTKIPNKTPSQKEIEYLLDSLDSLKKEIRIKFKRLTDQEFLVFSKIYQISEEDGGFADYKTISSRLNLTESSIRDYVRRIVIKGIPIEKKKINNKSIHLSISPSIKKITTLATISKLREL